MARETPTICRGRLARLSLSLAQIVFILGCLGAVVGGVVLSVVGILRGDILFVVVSAAGAAIEFILSFAFLVVFATTQEILFPQESHEVSMLAIQCENGHDITVTKAQAGSERSCPTRGSSTKVPALSEPRWDS